MSGYEMYSTGAAPSYRSLVGRAKFFLFASFIQRGITFRSEVNIIIRSVWSTTFEQYELSVGTSLVLGHGKQVLNDIFTPLNAVRLSQVGLHLPTSQRKRVSHLWLFTVPGFPLHQHRPEWRSRLRQRPLVCPCQEWKAGKPDLTPQ